MANLWTRLNVVNLVIIVLLIQFLANIFSPNPLGNLTHLLTAVLSATILDAVIGFARFKSRQFPKSGLITGLIIGLLIEPGSLSFGIPTVTIVAVIAILSKHLIRFRARHLFNPAGFGLLAAVALGAGSTLSWWGSAGTLYTTYLILPMGLLVVFRLRRLSIAIPFLIFSALLNSSPAAINSSTILFFALIMLVEPVTAVHAGYKGNILYALIAAVSLAALNTLSAYALPGSLCIANILGVTGTAGKHRQPKTTVPESETVSKTGSKKEST